MLYYALMFLTVGLMAGVLNVLEMPGVTIQISWILYGIGMVLVGVHLFSKHPTVRVT